MTRLLLVPGINNTGTSTTDLLQPILEAKGVEVIPFKYRTVRWYNARFRANSVAAELIRYTEPGDAVAGHSFGCEVIRRAMDRGAEFGRAVFIAAAVEAKIHFPCHAFTRLLNITNPYDRALSAGALMPWHPFGLLGRDGYDGPRDDRIVDRQHAIKAGPHNHTAPHFAPENIEATAQRIYEWIAP